MEINVKPKNNTQKNPARHSRARTPTWAAIVVLCGLVGGCVVLGRLPSALSVCEGARNSKNPLACELIAGNDASVCKSRYTFDDLQ